MELEVDLDVDLELSDSLVVVASPTVGVVGPIAASFLVESLELDQLGYIHSDLYPPAAVIRDGRPSPPIKVYGGEQACGPDSECEKVVVVYSEVPTPEGAEIPTARALVEWADDAEHVIVLEGIEVEAGEEVEPVEGVASTGAGCALLDDHEIHCLSDGVVTGLAGALLNEGVRQDREVICLVGPAVKDTQDSESAARLLQAVDRLVVDVEVDAEPLLEWADEQETKIKDRVRKSGPKSAPSMYG